MAWPWIAGNRGGGAVSSQGFGNRGGACSIENPDCGFAVQLVNVAAVAWWLALDDLGGGVVVAGEFQR